MKVTRQKQVDKLFEAALQLESSQRSAFLQQACAGDEELRREVESLLEWLAIAENGKPAPAPEPAGTAGASDQSRSLVGRRLGSYEILSLLGAGGMGEVYLARDCRLERIDALKILPVEMASDRGRMNRFLREAKATSALNHPNIATIYEIGEAEGIHFIAMEYVDGETLSSRVKRGPLEPAEVEAIGLQVADALEEAHANGVIHRDIKPGNLMLTARGRVKVLDFGLAKFSPKESGTHISTETQTISGVLMGTVEYMSPEQALGRDVDHRTDLFSLGVVLYELATGHVPFSGSTPFETIDHISHAHPESISSQNKTVSPELEQVIFKCLEKAPEHRHPSARALQQELKKLTKQPEPWLTRKLAVLLAGLALVLLLLAPPVRDVVKGLLRSQSPIWIGGAGFPAEKRVAVLPFQNTGADPKDQFLCDGLVETLTHQLAQLQRFYPGLIVISSSEARGMKDALQAQKNLGVNLVLGGSLQREGDGIRLLLKWIDAKTGEVLASRFIERPLSDVAVWQDGVAIELAEMIELALQPEAKTILRIGGTNVRRAYELFLEGRGYLSHFEKQQNIDEAINKLGQATKEDPAYALAYSKLGTAYWRKYDETKQAQWLEAAADECRHAIELESRLPEAHVTLGSIYSAQGTHVQAIEQFQLAMEIDRLVDGAHLGMAKAYQALGEIQKAEETYQKAVELRPDHWVGYRQLGAFYFYQRRYPEAIEPWRKVVDLTPGNARAHSNLGALYVKLERWDEARQTFEQSVRIEPNYPALANLGFIEFYRGRYREAARWYEEALKLDKSRYEVWGNLASAYHWVPDETKARANYERAIELAEQRLNVNPNDSEVLAQLVGYYGMLGKRDRALAVLRRALAASPDNSEAMFRAALSYEHWGQRNEALNWIRKALEHGYRKSDIERSPELEKLRADPRFGSLVHSTDKP
jgi:tetratricopeptide (TPR) repeat protein/predicted Ser/Thr protein kinase